MRKQANRVIVAGSVAGALALGVLGGTAIAGRQDTGLSLAAGSTTKTQAAGSGATPRAAGAGAAARPRLRALARKGVGVHGEATVRAKDGFAVRTWQRGDVTAVTSGSLTVKSVDGTSWTWKLDGATKVRKDGTKAGAAELAAGDRVLVAGTRTGDTRTSLVVVVPKKKTND